jgi:hypothetical protein
MSNQTIKVLIAGMLLIHGFGHFGALMAIAVNWTDRGTATGAWLPARSWLFPLLPATATTTVASIFWILSLIGFVAAALSFWGILVPGDVWRQLSVASAIVSMLGIVLFFGTWPMFNTLAALGVNIAVLVTQFMIYWPQPVMFGK